VIFNKKFVLGSANFTSAYGVLNSTSGMSNAQLFELMQCAAAWGIAYVDSAVSYGETHAAIGEVGANQFELISKIPENDCYSVKAFELSVKKIMEHTKFDRIDTLLFHSPKSFVDNISMLQPVLRRMISQGKIVRYGISAYDEIEVLNALAVDPEIGYVQISENILDRRKIGSTDLMRYSEKGVVFAVRSIFLQGLLLAAITDIPNEFLKHTSAIEATRGYFSSIGVSPLIGSLSYVNQIKWASQVVVGVQNTRQLREIIDASNLVITLPLPFPPKASIDLIDPRRWRN